MKSTARNKGYNYKRTPKQRQYTRAIRAGIASTLPEQRKEIKPKRYDYWFMA